MAAVSRFSVSLPESKSLIDDFEAEIEIKDSSLISPDGHATPLEKLRARIVYDECGDRPQVRCEHVLKYLSSQLEIFDPLKRRADMDTVSQNYRCWRPLTTFQIRDYGSFLVYSNWLNDAVDLARQHTGLILRCQLRRLPELTRHLFGELLPNLPFYINSSGELLIQLNFLEKCYDL